MAFDRGLVERVADVLERLGERGARQKNVFGGRGFLRGRSTFAIVWEDGLMVKTAPEEHNAALAQPGVMPFQPDGERPSRNWVVVSADLIADDPELSDWLRRALRALR
jgi:TfoX/Sxy family transcriptional regulator of competence genes